MTDTKLEAFIRNLKKVHGLTHEEFKKQYDYAGSDKVIRDKNGKEIASSGLKYAEKRGITFEIREKLHKDYCLCGTKIKENVYRQNTDMKANIIVIGNICNLRYNLGRIRKCNKCNAVHTNRKDNYCNTCRKERKVKKKNVKKKVEREKERFDKIKNHEFIHVDDLKQGSYYVYTKSYMNERKCVRFKLININKNELICEGYGRTWSIISDDTRADYIFYKRTNNI